MAGAGRLLEGKTAPLFAAPSDLLAPVVLVALRWLTVYALDRLHEAYMARKHPVPAPRPDTDFPSGASVVDDLA